MSYKSPRALQLLLSLRDHIHIWNRIPRLACKVQIASSKQPNINIIVFTLTTVKRNLWLQCTQLTLRVACNEVVQQYFALFGVRI